MSRPAASSSKKTLSTSRTWIFNRSPMPVMIYQLGWTTLPGLRGLSCSDFRATPTDAPDTNRGVAIEFASEADRDEFLRRIEAEFGPRRFTNAADAFDTVKAYALGAV
jgi:hypothetical protein